MADSLVGINPHPGPTRRGVRSRGEGRRRSHFESVSKDRYEERPEVIERAVRGAVDLRNDRRAKEANECLNVVPESEEIREAMKETRQSAPGL